MFLSLQHMIIKEENILQRRYPIMITGICLGLSVLMIACQAKGTEAPPITTSVPIETTAPTTEAPTASEPLVPDESQIKALTNKLKTEAGGEVVQFLCLDFDADKSFEAFAIVGTKAEQLKDTYHGNLWFVSDHTATQIGEASSYSYIERISIGEQYFMSVDKNHTGGSLSYVYGVKEGQACEDAVSGRLTGLKQEADGSFTAIQDAYDACVDETGHTWKPYWFYWDNGFHEYGGKELTEEALKQYSGSEKALEQINAEKGQISSILYRENGIININYLTPWTRDGVDDYINNNFLNLKLKDGKLTILEAEDNRGVYLPALETEIAVYP